MATFPKLKKYRQEAGLTQNKLSRLSEVSRDVISSAENGGSHQADKLHSLRNALNVYFYDNRPHKSIPPSEVINDE